jgi:hypothetical protein
MVFRLADDMLSIDGLMVYQPKNDVNWFACNKKRIGTIRLQALYLFLLNEEKDRRKRFEIYVDKIINNLIYNNNEH